jgi:hypothetical protein
MSAIVPSEITFYLTPNGNADPTLSLGGSTGTSQVGAGLHNLFDLVSSGESEDGDVEYRAIDVKNTNLVETLYNAVVYISQATTGPDDSIEIAYDATGAQAIDDESTPPADVVFSAPVSKATGIALGDIASGGRRRIWLKRTIVAGASPGTSEGELTVVGDTYDSGA